MNTVARTRLAMLLGLMVVVGAACEPFAVLDGSRLATNRKVWNDSGVTDYRMRVHIQKPGHATPMGKYIVEVRERTKTTIRSDTKPNTIVDTSTYLREFHRYDTIDEIFDFIEKNSRIDAAVQQITYDPMLGYPKRLHMDPARGTIDDELFFEVLEFEKL